MTYNLWIDDLAHDPESPERHAPSGWAVAISSAEAIELIRLFGPPEQVSWDHDLGTLPDGQPDTSMTIINYLIDNHYDHDIIYQVHSQNPIGRANIISKMESWKRSRALQGTTKI